MKLQLILKSSRAYYVLSDAAMILQKYGRALRYIKLALQCHGKFFGWICHLCHCLEMPVTTTSDAALLGFSLWCAVTSLTSLWLTKLSVQLSIQCRSL